MTNDPTERAHSHHIQRRRCQRWNWYIQQISGNENVVCANWFCTNRLALKALRVLFSRFFVFPFLGFPIFSHDFIHSHALHCLFAWVNRLSLFGSCVRGFVFSHAAYIRFIQFNTHVSIYGSRLLSTFDIQLHGNRNFPPKWIFFDCEI